jgi:hypothetical protein
MRTSVHYLYSAGDGRWIPYEEKIADKLEEEYTTAAKVIFNKVFQRIVTKFFIKFRVSLLSIDF